MKRKFFDFYLRTFTKRTQQQNLVLQSGTEAEGHPHQFGRIKRIRPAEIHFN